MKTVRELYRQLNNDNEIPEIDGEGSFTVEQMIWFAEQYYNSQTTYSQRDILISFACKLNNVSVEQYGKYYGNKVDEFLTNKQ